MNLSASLDEGSSHCCPELLLHAAPKLPKALVVSLCAPFVCSHKEQEIITDVSAQIQHHLLGPKSILLRRQKPKEAAESGLGHSH